MPLSKKRNRERMRLKRGSKTSRVVVLPRRLVRALRAAGIDPEKVSASPAVSEEAFKDMQRTLDAKEQRIAWQSGGIKLLHGDVAQHKDRINRLEVSQAIMEQRVAALSYAIAEMQAEAIGGETSQDATVAE